jgi:hypothetical protein
VRLAFLGTPEVAAGTLRALADAGHDVRIVVTRPDTRRGRGTEVSASPVKQAAEQLGLAVTHTLADVMSRRAPSWGWSSPTEGWSSPMYWRWCPWSTSIFRSCRAGGEPRPWNGHSWQETPKPAFA